MSKGGVEVRIESEQFPADRMQVRKVHGRERISSLFEFDVTIALPAEADVEPRAMAGALVTLVFSEHHAALPHPVEKRRLYAMIASVTDTLVSESDVLVYRLRLVPRAWRLSLVEMQEIYMHLSVSEIIAKKLDLVGLAGDYRLSLRHVEEPREFTVQYAESDLALVSRLTERDGYSYYFDHTDGRDCIVFCDENSGFHTVEGAETVEYNARGDLFGVRRLEATTTLVPAMYAVSDYNYQTPHVDISALCDLKDGYGGGIIEYNTHHLTPDEGNLLAKRRAERLLVGGLVLRGEAGTCVLTAGARFKLVGHPRLGEIELLVVAVEHHADLVAFGTGADEADGGYRATFECIPASTTYRPERSTPLPRIPGMISGIIEAAPDVETERAWIDDQGRYLVRMLFDTAAPNERKASLPIRMAQAHSGPGYGIHYPLRPGAEVLIAFIAGDPDRPVIVGSVPNPVTPTPVAANIATRHRIQTWSGVLVEIDDGG